jgi:hypothetical protein
MDNYYPALAALLGGYGINVAGTFGLNRKDVL